MPTDVVTEKQYELLKAHIVPEYWIRAQELCHQAEKQHIAICSLTDPAYPLRMQACPDLPAVLYVRGRLEINLHLKTCGVIGARRCARIDRDAAVQAAIHCCRDNIAVVSGMARGIDGYAHTAAMQNNGYTIAVLGCGVDVCYPPEHNRLLAAIAERGTVLSAYPPGTRPRKYFFPRRNRIIAACSDSLIVIGAGRNSGTRSTVEYYQKIGRTDLIIIGP